MRLVDAHWAVGLRAGLCLASLIMAAASVSAQQSQPSSVAACFSTTDPAAIVTACDTLLAGDRRGLTSDQTGLALQRRGGAYAVLGRIDDAIGDFRQMAATGYKVHEAHASIASLEFRRQRLSVAEASYREALRVNPSYALAQLGLGHTLIGLGRAAESIAHFDRALAITDTDPEAHLGKATALIATGDLDGAIRSLDAALRLDPRLLAALYQRAQAHHDKGDMTKALADADAAVAAASGEERIRALVYRGRLRNNAKSYDGTIADCTAADAEAGRLAVTDQRLRAAALVCVGLARQSKGDLTAAQDSYEQALRWDARDVAALAGRGYVLLQRGRYDAAAADFRAALAVDPRSQDALRFLGLAYADKGDRAKADQEFSRAIETAPNDPWPVMIRAITAARDGDRTRALADANRALEITGPRSSDGFLVRGAVHYFLDDMDKARIDVDTAISLNGDNGQAHRMLSRLLIRQGRLEEAQRSLDTASRQLPNDVTVMLQQGLIALGRRDYGRAVLELTRSLAINDVHAEGFAARGQANEGQGLIAAALAEYSAASGKLAIDGDGRRAKALAAERLAALTAPPSSAASTTAGTTPAAPTSTTVEARPPSPAADPGSRRVESDQSLYCRIFEGMFVSSRKYTGVEFDVGCRRQN